MGEEEQKTAAEMTPSYKDNRAVFAPKRANVDNVRQWQ